MIVIEGTRRWGKGEVGGGKGEVGRGVGEDKDVSAEGEEEGEGEDKAWKREEERSRGIA